LILPKIRHWLSLHFYYFIVVAGGQNKQHAATKNTAKLDRETEELHHEHVALDVCKLIQQSRQAKGWTQKELATVCHIKLTLDLLYFYNGSAQL
jgi:hypothetical protein